MPNPACLYPAKYDPQSRISAARASLNRSIALLETAHKSLDDEDEQTGVRLIVELVQEALEHVDDLITDNVPSAS